VALFVALFVIGALLPSTAKKGEALLTGGAGSRHDPIPLGHSASIGAGWLVKVDKVTPNADRLFRKNPPPAGAQNYLILVTLTYRGGGKDDAGQIVNFILRAVGAHGASYDTTSDGCGIADSSMSRYGDARIPGVDWPAPSLERAGYLFSGRSVRGNLCFQIARNDAKSLVLYSTGKGDIFISFPTVKTVYFSLRRSH
jgi:hypothetical protein